MKEYIKKIVELGKPEDMEYLSDIMVDMLDNLKETDKEKYKEYKMKLKGMAYDYTIDEELAIDIVKNMKPLGEYWNIGTIMTAIEPDTHRTIDMYVVMNSLVNDYKDVISPDDVNTYIKMAHSWIDDIDAKENKIWKYFIG